MFPYVRREASTDASYSFNFGQRPFAYTPPSGFVTLNTRNLPTPTIGATASTQANKYFNATLYTGNGTTTNVISSLNFLPDFLWIKDRTTANNHTLLDTLRGTQSGLSSNSTAAQDTNNYFLNSFNSNGFSLRDGNSVNQNGDSFVAWCWNAGSNTSSSNTQGTITSTVSANTTAGFSIVTFNSGSAGNQSFGHGLGVTPAFFVIKSRATSFWDVWHQSFSNPATNYMYLDLTNAVASDARQWANTAPNSTVISYESGYEFAANTNFVAYCFSQVAGYSAFGKYTGNGSNDGPFVFLGFRPRYVLVKKSSGTSNWQVLDSSRSPYNLAGEDLLPNASDAEKTIANGFNQVDMLSNGFKIRNTNCNDSGGTYIYACFAEFPFKFSLAR
jgi:hypothetical protein